MIQASFKLGIDKILKAKQFMLGGTCSVVDGVHRISPHVVPRFTSVRHSNPWKNCPPPCPSLAYGYLGPFPSHSTPPPLLPHLQPNLPCSTPIGNTLTHPCQSFIASHYNLYCHAHITLKIKSSQIIVICSEESTSFTVKNNAL